MFLLGVLDLFIAESIKYEMRSLVGFVVINNCGEIIRPYRDLLETLSHQANVIFCNFISLRFKFSKLSS